MDTEKTPRDLEALKLITKDQDAAFKQRLDKVFKEPEPPEEEDIQTLKRLLAENETAIGNIYKRDAATRDATCTNNSCFVAACISSTTCYGGACSNNGCLYGAGGHITPPPTCRFSATCGNNACRYKSGTND